jgi:hypothetical protein
MIRMNSIALLVALVAASGSTSAEHFGHSHSAGHGDCNCNQGHGSWNTGCCDQPNDCCSGWWDGYCAEKHHCKIKEKFAAYRSKVICNPAPSCGGCASDGCRTIAMPCLAMPKMPCLTMPKMPCLTMPKVSLPHSDCGTCRSIGGGCGCGMGLHSLKMPSLDFHSWRRPKSCLGGCSSCGTQADDCGCGHGSEVNYHHAPEYHAPQPPAYHHNAPVPAELNEAPLPPSDSPRTDEIERSAALSALGVLLP